MSVYLDTSVLVSLFHTDKHTQRTSAWITDVEDFVLSSWALAELSSALAVKVRMRHLPDEERRGFERVLDQWLRGRVILSAVDGDMVASRGMLRADTRLRVPDALHLAIASRHGCILATLDADMAAVGRDIGLDVVVP